MRQLFPESRDDVDPIGVYAGDDRSRSPERPWMMLNMISGLDGAISIDGVSGGLGGPADASVFGAIRAVADVILVGAGTVIAENYRPAQTPPSVQETRVARGQAPLPTVAIVSNSLSLPPDHRVLDPDHRPYILTNAAAPEARRAALAAHAEIIDVGAAAVDLSIAARELGARGADVVLVEGGPTLNGAVVEADLLDELCLTLSPLIIGGDGPRIVSGASATADRRFRLDRVLHADELTFLRYLRARNDE